MITGSDLKNKSEPVVFLRSVPKDYFRNDK